MGCVGMNKVIGITGGMSAGKSTLAKKIIADNKNYIYVDVDVFRRGLYENKKYVEELKVIISELCNEEIIDSSILNKYIYSDNKKMNAYKSVLYKYLFEYIDGFSNETIVVEWALIINDSLMDKFSKIIYVDASIEERLRRLENSDLTKEEILTRFKLQEIEISKYLSDKVLVVDSLNIDMEKVDNFIKGMECKFTLPEGGGKAIWEITHQCNYGCSYCIFSCNNKKIDGELSTEECFHVIDELVKKGFKHLKITGGEPFIRKDIIDILKYASKYLVTDISTNASLITDELVDKLNKINLKMIHVSLDGSLEEHESVRGCNTYLRTIKGLKCLEKSKNKVRIGSVIHVNNENSLEKLVNDSIKFKADEIIFSIMEPVEGQDRSLFKTKDNEVLGEEIEKLNEKYQDIIVNYNFKLQPNYVYKCPGGDKFLYINNLGKISPCPWVYENNKKCLSEDSLRDNSLDDILKDTCIVGFLGAKKEGKCYGKI